ncbi:MAG: class D beta-lactamase [Saprospiraceae bacterium]
MKLSFSFLILLLSFACSETSDKKNNTPPSEKTKIIEPAFQSILDSANVKGAILIFDVQSKSYYSNDFNWCEKGILPASTFKIPNSIIALETGVVENDSSLSKWDGEQKAFDIWERDLIFREAFHYSCVPCYQEIARKIGPQRMRSYLDKLNYGTIVFDANNIDLFWLEGKSRITPLEQIDFLQRFYQSELLIKKRTEKIMKELMIITKSDTYILSGKTGLSITNGHYNGWFVGYFESDNKLYYFATNIEPKGDFERNAFQRARKDVTFGALRKLGILEE